MSEPIFPPVGGGSGNPTPTPDPSELTLHGTPRLPEPALPPGPAAPGATRAEYASPMAGFESRNVDPDDWFAEPRPSPTRRQRRAGRDVRLQRGLLALGGVVILLVILAAFGVFSSPGKHAPPVVTTVTPPVKTVPHVKVHHTVKVSVAAPTTTLKPGAQGAQVRALQRSLAKLGFSPGKVDGGYGPHTEKALEAFQRAHALAVDGILGPKTLAALKKALRNPSAGTAAPGVSPARSTSTKTKKT